MAVATGPGTQFASPQELIGGALPTIGGPLTYDDCTWIDARIVQIVDDDVLTIASGADKPSIVDEAESGAGSTWSLALDPPTELNGGSTGGRATFVAGRATASGWAVVNDRNKVKLVAWHNEVDLKEPTV
jgi:hypothetical protein